MNWTLATRLFVALAALASVRRALAAAQGPVTLLCTWNQQCTSTGSCTSYTGSMHFSDMGGKKR